MPGLLDVPQSHKDAYTRLMERAVEDERGCLIYAHHIDKGGYAQIVAGGKVRRAHRLALAVYCGLDMTQMSPDHVAMHMCDTPTCVNPRHLRWGTHRSNVHDRIAKGRSVYRRSNGICPRGHFVHGANRRITSSGSAMCVLCARAQSWRHNHGKTWDEALAIELGRTDGGRAEVARCATTPPVDPSG